MDRDGPQGMAGGEERGKVVSVAQVENVKGGVADRNAIGSVLSQARGEDVNRRGDVPWLL